MKSAYRSPRIVLLAGAMLFTTSAWSLPPLAEPVVTRSMTVKYDPAEAATPAGAASLYGKLRTAASRVCANPGLPGARGFDDQQDYATCMTGALDKAVQHIGIPMLTALHAPPAAAPDTAVAKR